MKKLSSLGAAIMALLLNGAALGGPCLTIGGVTTDGVATDLVLPIYLSDPQGVVAVEVTPIHSYPQIVTAVGPGSALPATHPTYVSPDFYDGSSSGNLVVIEPTTNNESLPAGEVLRLHVHHSNGWLGYYTPGHPAPYVSVWYTVMSDKYGHKVMESCTAAELNNKIAYITVQTPIDSDSDGMPDSYEIAQGLNPNANDALGDLDGDGVSNYDEFLNGTNPTKRDSDGDGMPDGFELITPGLNALNPADALIDNDGDGLSNGLEYLFGTNLNVKDTNGNGISDYAEYQAYISSLLVPIINYLLE